MKTTKKKRIILGISGASGAIYGQRALILLQNLDIEVYLVISKSAETSMEHEIGLAARELGATADAWYSVDDIAAPIASGSFHCDGMLIAPCSIKTLSAVANSYADNLLSRAADVCLKEGRPLLLAVRETPLHSGHLRLMSLAAEAGAVIYPPVPAFYGGEESIMQLVDASVGRMLSRIGIENRNYHRWREG